MPKTYNEPGSPSMEYQAETPDAHSPGGGDYTVARGSQGEAGGGEYANLRGSQGEAGGGGYSWAKTEGGHSPGGGEYSWAKAESGTDPKGDEFKTGMAQQGPGLDIEVGPSMSTQPDPYNPYQSGVI